MPEPIFDDPVVAEIHAIRAQMLAECGGDIRELMRRVVERQHGSGHRVITHPLRPRLEPTPAPAPAARSVSSGESSLPSGERGQA